MIQLPKIIQGGMGVGVSNWRLANAVSKLGQLGVVSGTALDQLFIRRLADGDKGGHMRRGLDAFPFPEMAKRIWNEYFVPGGKPADAPYPLAPVQQFKNSRKAIELCIVSNFVEVFLAREGHKNPVGVNFLEKVQIPHLSSIYGAMLAGVGYILMGAGIPLHAPGVLDAFAAHRPTEYRLTVAGAAAGQESILRFDPAVFAETALPELTRPKFLAIISSNTLAATMLRRSNGKVDGFILETPAAGGHNAPPRGKMRLNEAGEPVYGDRDQVSLPDLAALGVPFWLGGGYGSHQRLLDALQAGAAGVQVGTAFAFTEESGLREDLKATLLKEIRSGTAQVFTDPLASPTGFPFKVALMADSSSQRSIYEERPRICDLGYLREAYATPEGEIGYRCAAEPLSCFLAKGGTAEEAEGRKCLCNALMANIGYGQKRASRIPEPALVTVGDELNAVAQFLKPDGNNYTVADVVASILGEEMKA